jgi:hypothetical protein
MTTTKDNYVKILFRFYSDVLEEETVETMWATIVDKEKGLYKLDNIPFYAPLLASGDIVFAEYDEDEGMLTFRENVEYSGNSTIQVVIMDKSKEINSVRQIFIDMGCVTERFKDHYFSMEVPESIDYTPIKSKLDELEMQEIIGYAEPCLADGHRSS